MFTNVVIIMMMMMFGYDFHHMIVWSEQEKKTSNSDQINIYDDWYDDDEIKHLDSSKAIK